MSLFEQSSICITPNGTKASKLYAIKPTSGAGDLSVTRATTATRVNSAGLIESVAVNVPRLDYTNSTCPSILVEPQRTNIFTYSEQFDNAAWGAPANVIANTVVSPDGTTTGDTLTGGLYRLQVFSSITYVFSFYAKKNTQSTFSMRVDAPTNQTFTFNLDTGTADGGCSMINVGNGWYRCFMPFTSSITGTGVFYPNVGGNNFYIWGAQLEAGAYATSYIPTVASAVTRNADVISKTGISSLIGQTEGTIFLDFNVNNISSQTINPVIFSFNSINFIEIFTDGRVLYIDVTGNISIDLPSYNLTNGRHKFAIAYNTNDVAFYIDGSLAGTDTSGTPSAKNDLILGYSDLSYIPQLRHNTVSLWKTRLTNAELAEITTI